MRKVLILAAFMAAAAFGIVFLAFGEAEAVPDRVFINDAVMTALQAGDAGETAAILNRQLTQAFEDMDMARASRDKNLQIFLYLVIGLLAAVVLLMYFYCEKSIIKPFKKLQNFARFVAAGNFDIPLEMDKGNLFGAFTESFDLMRDELKKARENERAADRSKKELVASLSHDIKTPVASIKAVVELMSVRMGEGEHSSPLRVINEKAEQINSLITNIFHATLEELQALSVNAVEIPSAAIPNLIKNADYEGQVMPFEIPSCLVFADSVRLQQVFDNIIVNSYKYAGTEIKINSAFDGRHLVVEIVDFGAGVLEEELPLILNKFYRGKNADFKGGYGLGLYISKYLMEAMGGGLFCENCAGGFAVKVLILLA